MDVIKYSVIFLLSILPSVGMAGKIKGDTKPKSAFTEVGPLYNAYQKESVALAKKLLPPQKLRVKSTKVRQNGDDLWITLKAADPAKPVQEEWVYEIYRRKGMLPVLFYKHLKFIDIILSNNRQLLLINDYPRPRIFYVAVADVKTGKNWRIDFDAANRYSKMQSKASGKEGYGFFPYFTAVGFSSDDKQVLLKLEDTQQPIPKHTYVPWYCSVYSMSGKMAKEFTGCAPGSAWWR